MSTKPIREALEYLTTNVFPCECDDCENGARELKERHAAALEAVRAIEEMARFMVNVDTLREPDADGIRNAAKFNDLLESIAKEAP